MSEIPSDIAASAAQAGYQAQEAGKEREARRAGPTQAAHRQVQSLDEAETTVETTDNDTKVSTDAEGSGSMGSPFEEEETQQQEDTSPKDGITRDDDGRLHVDLEA